jgi:RNA polymerase sigma-70 factor, ECF subfamily
VERDSERELVARLKRADAGAFDAIYASYRPRLYSFLVRLTRRPDVAEDLLEETWLRLVASASRLSDDTSLAAWLFTVARNLYTSWCRHRAVDEARIAEPPASWPVPSPGESPFESAARSETEGRLERALARLGDREREALLLVAVESLSPSEAAAVVGVAPEALRKRLQRARERLAASMEVERGFGGGDRGKDR